MAETGSCTVTYRKKLLCRHPEWLENTKALYNEVLNFYYKLLRQYPEIGGLSAQKALRELEKLTIQGRDGTVPFVPIPFLRVPLYFRRAAINSAVAMMHSYQEKKKNWEVSKAGSCPEMAGIIHASPLFYKGMYKELKAGSVLLKVFTGNSWCWIKCRLKGRDIPDNGICMSPTVVLGKQSAMLHIPVKTEVADARSVKERMGAGEKVCGVTFTNQDTIAVCVVYTADGRATASRFIRGGKEYVHHSKRLLKRINTSCRAMGKRFDWSGANKRDWAHLGNLRNYISHKVSREIIDFCKKHGVSVIAITKSFEQMPSYMKKRMGAYKPLALSAKIRLQLQYKAWHAGMVITGVRPQYTAVKCSVCRSYLKKDSKYHALFCCEQGHKGNRALNTANNIAKMSLKKFGKTESTQILFA